MQAQWRNKDAGRVYGGRWKEGTFRVADEKVWVEMEVGATGMGKIVLCTHLSAVEVLLRTQGSGKD